jgi:heptosyltransferase-2
MGPQPLETRPAKKEKMTPAASTRAHVLVRGVNWLGDSVMATPALLRLREHFPAAHITLLTPAKLKDLWSAHPAINSVRTFEDGESSWSIGRRLRDEKADLALVLPNSPRSALEVWLAHASRRVGYARPWRNWFLNQAIAPRPEAVPMHKRTEPEINQLVRGETKPTQPPSPRAHHIYEYLHLTAALGANPAPLAPKLAVADDSVAKFAARFKPAEVPWFGLNPGAEYGPAKRWPEERFVEAAIQIQRRANCGWLIFGATADKELADRIAAAVTNAGGKDARVLNLAGETSLAELCAGLKFCRVLLTNDSGPMHVAAALGTPVVVPFGSTSPELTGPGLPGDARHQLLRANAPCSPCFLRACPIDFRCMTGISVDQVVAAVLRAAG